MKSKLKFIIPVVVLLVLGGVYKFVLAAPPAKAKPPKVDGQVYILPKEFVVNLADGQYAKFNVALVLDHSQATAPAPAGGEEAAATPPDGYGTLEQEAVVRDIITDEVSGAGAADLTKKKKRAKLKKALLKDLLAKTDVKVEEVLLTDIAVQ
jgi:flagellar basal body-associated protein FliL